MIEKAYSKAAGRNRSQEDIDAQTELEEKLKLQAALTVATLNVPEVGTRRNATVVLNKELKAAAGLPVPPVPRRIYEAGKTYRAWSVR